MRTPDKFQKFHSGNDTALFIDTRGHGGRIPFGHPHSLLLRTSSYLLCFAFYEMVLHTSYKAQGLHLSFEKVLNSKLQ